MPVGMNVQARGVRALMAGALLASFSCGTGKEPGRPTSPAPVDGGTPDAPSLSLDAGGDLAPTIPDDAGQLTTYDPSVKAGLTIPADALVDEAGKAPALPITIRLQAIPINRHEDMPGGWRAVDAAGRPVAHATGGVLLLEATGRDGRRLVMRPGRVFRLNVVYDFTDPPALLHLDEPARLWREQGKILPDDTSNSLELEASAFGLWSFGKIAPPLCRTGLLKNACGEVLPNASVVGLATYEGLRFGDAATSDAGGRISFQSGYPEPNAWIDARVTFAGRTLRVPLRVENQPGACEKDGDVVVPSCDGVECYSAGPGSSSGGNCIYPGPTCPLSWEVYGDLHCTDGHRYRWGCGGDVPDCGCVCIRDDVEASRCANQPAPCRADASFPPGPLCITGPIGCAFPRHVPKRAPPRRPCDTDADCVPILPHCSEGFCDR